MYEEYIAAGRITVNGRPARLGHPVNPARDVIAIANRWREKLLGERGTRFVFPSDEFYLQADIDVPADEEYEDYGQIDDGVGLLRLLETEFTESYDALPAKDKKPTGGKKIAVACGTSAAPFLQDLLEKHPVTGTEVTVHAVENERAANGKILQGFA